MSQREDRGARNKKERKKKREEDERESEAAAGCRQNGKNSLSASSSLFSLFY